MRVAASKADEERFPLRIVRRVGDYAPAAALLVLLVFGWEAWVRVFDTKPYILPSPSLPPSYLLLLSLPPTSPAPSPLIIPLSPSSSFPTPPHPSLPLVPLSPSPSVGDP